MACVFCGGDLIQREYQDWDRPFDQIPIGPASKRCLTTKKGPLHCGDCGLAYAFDPHKVKENKMRGRLLTEEEAAEVRKKLGKT